MKKVSILGSTGSIGVNTLDVLACHPEDYQVFALSGWRQVERLYEQCLKFSPEVAVVADASLAGNLAARLTAAGCSTQVLHGSDALIQIASDKQIDIVVAAIVGAAGLAPTLAAAQAGKRILLANKEALVVSGRLLLDAVKHNQAQLLPVDSEHNAILQSLPANYSGDLNASGVDKLILTASGGPFLKLSKTELRYVTPEAACTHPNWSMGRKISVDSASLMNKGLEVIEAHWLFNAPTKYIEVVVHPQSIIHSMVQYCDGSVIAQMGMPDMRTPIASALSWPKRIANNVAAIDWLNLSPLSFERPDKDRFHCLQLAFDAINTGGDAPLVLNAANEVAVAAFLAKQISFLDIPTIIADTLNSCTRHVVAKDLVELLVYDQQAREFAQQMVKRK